MLKKVNKNKPPALDSLCEEKSLPIMLCKICSTEETDNPDGICNDYKFCIINNEDIPPGF